MTESPKPDKGCSTSAASLDDLPADLYVVRRRHQASRPWVVDFNDDVTIAGFPFRAGSEGAFKSTGEIISGTLSRPIALRGNEFPAGTFVRFYKGHHDGRVSDVRLGADQVVQGIPCKGGKNVLFTRTERLESATLATPQDFDGVHYRAGSWIAFGSRREVIDWRAPEWDEAV